MWFTANGTYAQSAPTVSAASVNGTQLTVDFSTALDSSSVPGTTAFSVSISAQAAAVSAVSIAGSRLTLTLANSVPDTDCVSSSAVTVGYTPPASNPLRGAGQQGQAVAAFSGRSVTNSTDLPPALSSAVANTAGDRITLTFCEQIAAIDWWQDVTAFALSTSQSNAVINDVEFGQTTVTLVLRSSKTLAQGETVTLSYDNTKADDDKELRDADQGRKLVPSWSNRAVTNNTDTAPEPVSGTVLYDKITLTFDQELDPTSVPATSSWSFGNQVQFPPNVTSVSISGAKVTLTLSQVILPSIESFFFEYEPPSQSPLRDKEQTNDAEEFSDLTVTNKTPSAAPTLSEAAVNGNALTLTYNQPLQTTSTPPASDFTVSGVSGLTVSSVSITGSTVTLSLSAAVAHSDTITVSYLRANSQREIRGRNNKRAAAFSNQAVTNATPDPTPTLSSAAINTAGSKLTLTFSDALLATTAGTPATSTFALAGTSATVASVSVNAAKVVLTLSPPADVSEMVTVAYTAPANTSSPRLTSQDGNNAVASWTAQAVTNNADGIPRLGAAVVADDELTLTFDRSIDSMSIPAASVFSLSGTTATISTIAVSGTSVTLTLSSKVVAGASVSLSYSQPTTNPLKRSGGTQRVASFSSVTVTNQTLTPPQTSSLVVNGAKLTVTFDADLDTASTATKSQFAVTAGGSATSIKSLAIATRKVTLTLTSAVTDGAAVKLTFAPTATARLLGSNGAAVEAFSNTAVTNQTDTAPTLASAAAAGNGSKLTLQFSEPLRSDTAGTPAAASFALAGTDAAVSEVAVSGKTVTLTLDPALHETDTATISYTQPSETTAARLRDADQSKLAVVNWTAETVANTVDTAPQVAAAQIDGSAITVTFDQDLDLMQQPAKASFELSPSRTFSSVSLTNGGSGGVGKLELTISKAVREGDKVSLTFRASGNSKIIDPEGNAARIRNLSLTNKTDTPTTPTGATGNGSSLAITFSLSLKSTQVPAAAAFSLSGTDAVPQSVSISAAVVTLTLSPALGEGESVTVSYTPPSTNKLVDTTGTVVAAFSQTVTNETDTAPAPSRVSISGPTMRITFDQTLDQDIYPGISAFAVRVNNSAVTVRAVEVSGADSILRLAEVARRGESVTVTYTKDPDYGFRDASGLLTPSFGPLSATHTGPPLPVSGTVDGDVLTLTFDSALDTASVPPKAAFTIDASDTVKTVSISGKQLTLDLSQSVAEDDALRIRYRAADAGTTPLQGTDGADVVTFDSDKAQHRLTVVNQTDTAPALATAQADLKTVKLTFDQTLDLERQPRGSEFAASPSKHEIAAVVLENVQGRGVVTLTLKKALAEDEALSLTYTPRSAAAKMADPEGNPVSISVVQIENQTDTAPVPTSGDVDGKVIVVNFDQSLYLEPRPIPLDHFTISSTSTTVSADEIEISNDAPGNIGRLEITLDADVHELDTVSLHYSPTSGSVRITDDDPKRQRAQINHYTLNNSTDTAPAVKKISADGRSVVVTFDQPLAARAAPPASAFSLGANAPMVDSLAIDGAKVMLTLSGRVVEDQELTLAYTPPAQDGLRDPTDNLVAAFSHSVENDTDYAPFPISAASDEAGEEITVQFDQALNPGVEPTDDAFQIDAPYAVSLNRIETSKVILDLADGKSLREGASVSIRYVQPAQNGLQDDDRPNLVAGFTISVENRTDVAPLVKTASIDGQTLRIRFDQALDESSVPPPNCAWIRDNDPDIYPNVCVRDRDGNLPTWFEISDGNATSEPSAVAIDGSAVALTLAQAASPKQDYTVSYTHRHVENRDWALRDTSQSPNYVESFTEDEVADKVPASPTTAAVRVGARREIAVVFNAALSSSSLPSVETFTVLVAGASTPIANARVSGSTLTMVLNSAVADCAAVRLAYAANPEHSWTDDRNLEIKSFELAVTNRIDAASGLTCLTSVGNQLILDFDREVSGPLNPSAWTVAVNAAPAVVQNAAAGERQVTLTLESAACMGQAVQISSTGDGGLPTFSFSRQLDRAAPCPVSAQVNLTDLRIRFDQALTADALPDVSSFVAAHAPVVIAVTGIDDSTLSLRLAEPGAGPRDDITLNYSGRNLQGQYGAVGAFQIAVDEQGRPPRMTAAYAIQDTVLILFDRPLLERAPANSQWLVLIDSEHAVSVTDTTAGGSVALLTLSQPLRDEEQVTVIYIKRTRGGLAGRAGHQVAMTAVVPINATQTPPAIAAASVERSVIEVEFDQQIEAEKTSTRQFTVLAGRREIEVSSLHWRRSGLRMVLAEPVTALDAVQLSYTPPVDGTGVRDRDGKLMEPQRVEVMNRTKRPSIWSEQVQDARLRAGSDAELPRELMRAISSPGLNAPLTWPRDKRTDEHEPAEVAQSGIAARVLLHTDPKARSNPEIWRLHVEHIERFAPLRELLPRGWQIAWDGDARNRFVAAWRIDVCDRAGTPMDYAADMVLQLPRPAVDGPYRAFVFDLLAQKWAEVQVAPAGLGIRVRLHGPSLLMIAAMEPVETILGPGVTELVFNGADGTLLSEFAELLDESVAGAWVAEHDGEWRYYAVDGLPLSLKRGQTMWLARSPDAEEAVVTLPAPAERYGNEVDEGD